MARRPRQLRLDDPGLRRDLERLLAERRAQVVMSDAELDAAAAITTADVVAAADLWRAANRGTDLAGLLDRPPAGAPRA